MPSNINTVLADCEQNAKALIEEIEKYRAARILSDQVAESLEELCSALRDTHERIKPFTSVFARRILIGFGFALMVNIGLLVAVLYMLLPR